MGTTGPRSSMPSTAPSLELPRLSRIDGPGSPQCATAAAAASAFGSLGDPVLEWLNKKELQAPFVAFPSAIVFCWGKLYGCR